MGTATLQFTPRQGTGGRTPLSYALVGLHVLLGCRGLLVLAALGAGLGGGRGAAAGGGQQVGGLQHGLRVLARLHAQRRHAGRAVALAAVGGQEGQAHGVWNAARAQRAPWGGRREASHCWGRSWKASVPSMVSVKRTEMGLIFSGYIDL